MNAIGFDCSLGSVIMTFKPMGRCACLLRYSVTKCVELWTINLMFGGSNPGSAPQILLDL